MLADLQRILGREDACLLLGLPIQSWRNWMLRRESPSAPARKLIWIVWSLVCRPDLVTSLFDVATWGRFRVERREAPPGDYEI